MHPQHTVPTAHEQLVRFEDLATREHHLGVLVTRNKDGSVQASVVNFGIVPEPTTGEPRLGFVSRRGRKLDNLRRDGDATVVVRSGWEWLAVHGRASLVDSSGPEGAHRFGALARDIYHAAGGHHDDLDRFDQVMVDEGRCAVLIRPDRFSTNPPGTEHQEPHA